MVSAAGDQGVNGTCPPRSVVFWDQYYREGSGHKGIGGIERLIANLTCALGPRVPVKLIAPEGSVICDLLRSQNSPHRRLDPAHDFSGQIGRDDLLVSFGTYRSLTALSGANPRFLLWRVYPEVGADGLLSRMLFKRLFLKLDAGGSLAFMDRFCRDETNRRLRVHLDSPVLRIPIEPTPRQYAPRRLGRRVRLTYVGRGTAIWKIKPVKKLVSDLSRIKSLDFELHIFTDTATLFESELSSVNSPKVRLKFHLGVFGDRLRQALLELADVHFAMATAALEGAAVGIPTILADASFRDFPDHYRYRWLTEDLDYYAGVFLESGISRPGRELDAMLAELTDPDRLAGHSSAAHRFVGAHFSSVNVSSELLAFGARARVSSVLQLMPHYWLQRVGLRRG